MRVTTLCLLLCLLGVSSAYGQILSNGTGLQAAAAIDIVGKTGDAGLGFEDRLVVREAEFLVFAPIDHLFDGMLNMAAHLEEDGALFEIHEAYIGSTKLIPRSRFRLGQYFLQIGRLNQFHRHDWPFTSAPKVQAEFFDQEGALDTGLEFSTLLPTSRFWDVTVGVTNGFTFGHSHTLGEKPDTPTHYLRSVNFFDLPYNGGTQIGLNYLDRKDAVGTDTRLVGVDATGKWREGRTLTFLVQSEVWTRFLKPVDADTETTLGGYLYLQYGLSPIYYVGLRGDWYNVLTLKDASGKSVDNGTYALVPNFMWRPSEFSMFRISYTVEWDKPSVDATQVNHAVEFQVTFILGAHPAHDF